MAANQRYNIVFIMTDQQRQDMIGCYGSPWMHTPHLDRLAASGCRFTHAFTTTPVCTPARAGLFTGMYSSSSGAGSNQEPVYRTTDFLGEIFGQAGCTPACIGKWHLNGTEGGYYGNGRPDGGFLPEYWYDGRNFIDDVGEAGFRKWQKGQDLVDSDCWGTRVADRAIDFLEKHHTDPFLLCVSFDEPHGPSSAPQRFYDMYKGSTRPWQPNMGDHDLIGKPRVHRAYQEMKIKGGYVEPGTDPNNHLRYFGCTSFVDEQIGRVLDAVDRHCPDNTVVVFTTDHGDLAGAHGMTGKGPVMYEETIRVPLIVRMPGVTTPGSVCESLVSHIHLAPTLNALAGLQPHPQYQGTDMLPLLRDPAARLTDAVFLEYNRFGITHDNHWGFVPSRTVRTERYKLVLNMADQDELYDLAEDPGELHNRICDPSLADIRTELHDRLLDWQDDRLDPLRGQWWWARPWRPNHNLNPFGRRMDNAAAH